jgi:opacity protein-like surface antigen
MLRKGLLSGLAILGTMTSAFADDPKPLRRAPPPSTAPAPPSWTGFYAGPTLGWATGRSEGYYRGNTPPPVGPIGRFDRDHCPDAGSLGNPALAATAAPFLAQYVIECLLDPITPGAVFGYNIQWAKYVIGIEGDVGWIGRNSRAIWAPDGSERYDEFGVTWHGHARARFGYPVSHRIGQFLPYIAGGLAVARYNVAHYRADETGSVLYEAHDTRFGYTLGGGIEIADLFPKHLPGLVVRGEYLYDYFPEKQYDWVPGMRYTVLDLTMHTLRGALIYRFSVP